MMELKLSFLPARLKYHIKLNVPFMLAILLISSGIKSQDVVKPGPQDSSNAVSIETPNPGKIDAKFMGGDVKKFQEWIKQNLIYPPDALKRDIHGDVLIQYTITPAGKISDVTILKGRHPLLDAEAIRVVQSSPDWEPAKRAGLNTEQRNVINVRFKDKMDQSNPVSAETETADDDTIDYGPAFVLVQLDASFQGGDINTFMKWIQQNLIYPPQAKESGISGPLTVQFNVDSYGKVVDVKILRSPDSQFNDETIRVIRSSPRWKPAMQSGSKVKQMFVIPVYFNLYDPHP